MVIHPRDNALVVGTHGRVDLDPRSPRADSGVRGGAGGGDRTRSCSACRPAMQCRTRDDQNDEFWGHQFFLGENPPTDAVIQFHLKKPVTDLAVQDHGRDRPRSARPDGAGRIAMRPAFRPCAGTCAWQPIRRRGAGAAAGGGPGRRRRGGGRRWRRWRRRQAGRRRWRRRAGGGTRPDSDAVAGVRTESVQPVRRRRWRIRRRRRRWWRRRRPARVSGHLHRLR